VTQSNRRRRGRVELATARSIREIGELPPGLGGLAEVAKTLARSLDDGAGLATAAVARELRATMLALTKTDGGGDDGWDSLLTQLSTPLGDAPPS
jgi:hypothetical protein